MLRQDMLRLVQDILRLVQDILRQDILKQDILILAKRDILKLGQDMLILAKRDILILGQQLSTVLIATPNPQRATKESIWRRNTTQADILTPLRPH